MDRIAQQDSRVAADLQRLRIYFDADAANLARKLEDEYTHAAQNGGEDCERLADEIAYAVAWRNDA